MGSGRVARTRPTAHALTVGGDAFAEADQLVLLRRACTRAPLERLDQRDRLVERGPRSRDSIRRSAVSEIVCPFAFMRWAASAWVRPRAFRVSRACSKHRARGPSSVPVAFFEPQEFLLGRPVRVAQPPSRFVCVHWSPPFRRIPPVNLPLFASRCFDRAMRVEPAYISIREVAALLSISSERRTTSSRAATSPPFASEGQHRISRESSRAIRRGRRKGGALNDGAAHQAAPPPHPLSSRWRRGGTAWGRRACEPPRVGRGA